MNKKIKSIIKSLVPPVLLDFGLGDAQKCGFRGKFSSWEEAQQVAIGYEADTIVEKVKEAMLKVKKGEAVYERDSVLFDTVQYSWPVLAGLLWIASRNGNRLNLVDFGGSLGSNYYAYRKFFEHLNSFHWNIVEQKKFVRYGKKLFEDDKLKFYSSLEDCQAEQKANAILLSSVIQYIEKPYELLAQIKDKFQYIMFDRTPFLERNGDVIMIYDVQPEIYKASIPTWLLDMNRFKDCLKEHFELLAEHDNFSQKVSGCATIYWKGFIFMKKR